MWRDPRPARLKEKVKWAAGQGCKLENGRLACHALTACWWCGRRAEKSARAITAGSSLLPASWWSGRRAGKTVRAWAAGPSLSYYPPVGGVGVGQEVSSSLGVWLISLLIACWESGRRERRPARAWAAGSSLSYPPLGTRLGRWQLARLSLTRLLVAWSPGVKASLSLGGWLFHLMLSVGWREE